MSEFELKQILITLHTNRNIDSVAIHLTDGSYINIGNVVSVMKIFFLVDQLSSLGEQYVYPWHVVGPVPCTHNLYSML